MATRRLLALWAAAFLLTACGTVQSETDGPASTIAVGPTTSTVPATSATSNSTVARPVTTTSTTNRVPTYTTPTTTTVDAGAMLLPIPIGAPPSNADMAEVTEIVDGDTIRVRLDNGDLDRVRLIGVNSAEQHECMAEEAANFLAPLQGSPVGLTSDESDRDQYGRLLRYVWWGVDSVNEQLVRSGLAVARRYVPDVAMAEVLERAQAEAQADGIGMWGPSACGPEATAHFEIVDVEFDAPGDDNKNLNEEWVRIRNAGDDPESLAGWAIKDESASHRYFFPLDLSVVGGGSFTVHTGCGQDIEFDLYWCNTGSAVWNNDGDTAFLLDPNGNIVDSYGY